MSFKPNLKELFSIAFGSTPVMYKLEETTKQHNVSYDKIPVKETQQASRMSWMGTPILFPVKFVERFRPNGTIEVVGLEDWYLPPASLVDFRRAKNITKTRIVGNNGTVKELYGFEDWQTKNKRVLFRYTTRNSSRTV